jgi:hypothetical protein
MFIISIRPKQADLDVELSILLPEIKAFKVAPSLAAPIDSE